MRKAICVLVFLSISGRVCRGEDYRGRFTPDADYVLSGKLAADLPSLPPVGFSYVKKGFASDRMSKVPPTGVHPRVALSPSDIEDIRAKVKLGPRADRVFRVMYRELRNKAARRTPDRENFGQAPWAGIGVIGAKALLALITEDKDLGRHAAEWTVKHAQFLEPRIDILNTHPAAKHFKDNFYYFSRTAVKVGGEDYTDAYRKGGAGRVKSLAAKGVEFVGSDHQWAYTSLGSEYDYAYNFMTDKERSYVRSVIKKSTFGKYTTGMEIPGHFFINNHMSMGAEFLPLALSIEGEDGYDPRILKVFAPRLVDKLTYDISPDGTLYENVKGFIPRVPILAVARRRAPNLLRHSHLTARMYAEALNAEHLYNRYIHRSRNRPRHALPKPGENVEEPRFWSAPSGRSLQFVWMIKHFYPNDPVVDFLYKVRNAQSNFDVFDGGDSETNYGGRIHYNDRNELDLQLLCATDGLRDKGGKVIDYSKVELTDEIRKLPLAWKDLRRGIAAARSSWGADASVVHYECRSDMFYAGHETPEQGDFTLSAHGVRWSPYTGPYMDCYFRNMVLIDGMAGVYQPVAGKLMSVVDKPAAATFVSDATDGYNWRKREKNFYMWHDMLDQNPVHTNWLKHLGFRMSRDWELPFQKHMREFYDGFAHLDWGPWHGETRGPEYFQRWNRVDHVFRTLHMARGEHPYILIVDDVRKDRKPHQYDWCFNVTGDAVLYSANSKAKNRHLTPDTEGAVGTDLLLCLADTPRRKSSGSGLRSHRVAMQANPVKGDPMLLVRVLWRNTKFPYPLPSFEKTWKWNRIKVPAMAVAPEFRVLIYPHRFGDPLPMTKWSDDRTQLTVNFEKQTDTYSFARTDRDRTVFTMKRGGKVVAGTFGRPPAPRLDSPVRWGRDRNRSSNQRTHLFSEPFKARLKPPVGGASIRYTLDGSEPRRNSKRHTHPIPISETVVLKARTFHDAWATGPAVSRTTAVRFVKAAPAKGIDSEPTKLIEGLDAAVYELRHTIFDSKGFFSGAKNMLPDLDRAEPIAVVSAPGFAIPSVTPKSPPKEMKKGYYRFKGFFSAPVGGVYRFRVNSCGPVTLRLGAQTAIEVAGPYGLSQKDRFGEASLAKGLHAVELIVCDPVFWKGAMEAPMPLSVAVMPPGGDKYAAIPGGALSRQAGSAAAPNLDTPAVKLDPVKVSGPLVPGLSENRYDWTERIPADCLIASTHWRVKYHVPVNGLPQGFFSGLDKAVPYARRTVEVMSGNNCLKRLVVYTGYFRARQGGEYAFAADSRGANELLLGGKPVLRNRMQSPRLSGKVILKPGLYPIEIRIADGKALLKMKAPGRTGFQRVVPGDLLRPSTVQAISGGDRLEAHMDFEKIAGVKGVSGVKAVVEGGRLVDGVKGKALALKGPHSKVTITGLHMPDDAATIAFWCRRGRHGDSFPLEGFPSKFNVRFRSRDAIWASYFRSQDVARVSGGKDMSDKKWTHVAFCFGNTVQIYVNGERKGTVQVDRSALYSPTTDARAGVLTLMRGEEGMLDELRVYNRILSADEIRKLAKK